MRVLITGLTGFAGTHLARHAEGQGATVTGVGSRPAAAVSPPAQVTSYVQADLLDASATRAAVESAAPERVFHLAASASVAASWRDPAATVEANVVSTLNLLAAVHTLAPAARVLVAGSGEQYGEPQHLPVDEDHPQRPRNPYALSKACADLAAGFHADAHGLHVVRSRAFNHAGPGQSEQYVTAAFARQIAAAELASPGRRVEVVTGNLEPRRDFTDVRDAVRAYWMLLDGAEPGAYNVCRGESVSAGDILAALAAQADVEVRQRTDPQLLRAGEVMDIRGSHEKLTKTTGWRPEIPFEQTLRDTLAYWRDLLAAQAAR